MALFGYMALVGAYTSLGLFGVVLATQMWHTYRGY